MTPEHSAWATKKEHATRVLLHQLELALKEEKILRLDAERKLMDAQRRLMDLHNEVVRLTSLLVDLKGREKRDQRKERSAQRRGAYSRLQNG
jgi:predicted  nucleic acid-binding Zn-ribbon protein